MLEVNLVCPTTELDVNVPGAAVVPRVGEFLYWDGTAYEVKNVTYEWRTRENEYSRDLQDINVTVASVVVEPVE